MYGKRNEIHAPFLFSEIPSCKYRAVFFCVGNGMPQKEQVEVTIPAFRAVSVFDVSQTDGKPIPELETSELLSTVEGYEDFVRAVMNVAPVPIGFEDIPGDSKGYFHTQEKRIAVQENMSESQTLKTMVHEVAHSMLHASIFGNKDDTFRFGRWNAIHSE